MELTKEQQEREQKLETKYQGVLTYVDAKHFLENTPYTAAKINGVIKRFVNSDRENNKLPTLFIEMESFVNDLADFWIDQNPEVHTDGESTLHNCLSNYIAFSIVWKAKSKASQIINPDLMAQVGQMIVYKNALGHATMIVNSRIAHDACPNKELYGDFKNALPDAFLTILPVVHGLHTGQLTLPEGQTESDLNRLIGGFFAGNPAVIGATQSLKQILHCQKVKQSQTLTV
ncbi:MAG: hypothetical protein HQK63_06300 [Desulfamplus sp.]|nr:hypothetical protein [Desulfamplus sp.]